jgi:hypothetical protein
MSQRGVLATGVFVAAGYLFTLSAEGAVGECATSGIYGNLLSQQPDGIWKIFQEATLADFATMRAGDNVYFFSQRRIYGVGALKNVAGDCRFDNFSGASQAIELQPDDLPESILYRSGEETARVRWACTFEPSPMFFTTGVDMDDVLSSNPPAFRMVRALEGRSFVKLGDEENQALRDAILRANQEVLAAGGSAGGVFKDGHQAEHKRVRSELHNGGHELGVRQVVAKCRNGRKLTHEMAIELAVLDQLNRQERSAVSAFGKWDYLAHQVLASPFKPLRYADFIDVFGYAHIPGHPPTIARYLVVEIKAGRAKTQDVWQLLRYVDWVKDEYAYGDYSMIDAYLLANSFSEEATQYVRSSPKRFYTVQRRPARSGSWDKVSLVSYQFEDATGRLKFITETPAGSSQPADISFA